MPRLIDGRDLTSLLLTPTEGFVASLIDGQASVAMLADLTTLEPGEVAAIVDKLIAQEVAEWVFETVSLPRATGRPALRTPVEPFPPPAFPRDPPTEKHRKARSSRPRADPAAPLGEGGYRGAGTGTSDVVDGTRRSQFPPMAPRASHTGSLYPPGEVEDNTAAEAQPFGAVVESRAREEEDSGTRDLTATIEALNRVTRSLTDLSVEEVSAHAPTEPPPPHASRTAPTLPDAKPAQVPSDRPPSPRPPPRSPSRPPSRPPAGIRAPTGLGSSGSGQHQLNREALGGPAVSAPRPPRVPSVPAVPVEPSISPEQLAEELNRMANTIQTTAKPPSVPPEAIDEELDLDPDRQKRINDLYYALDLLDHYQVLGVPRGAEKREIRDAYFGLSKVFHPDTMFRKRLGGFKARMEGIFKRLTEAYDVLGKKRSRADYDRYLELQDRTRVVDGAEANRERDRVGREAARAASELAGISLSSFPRAEPDVEPSPEAPTDPGTASPDGEPSEDAAASSEAVPERQMSEAGREAKKRLMAQRLRNAARVSAAGRGRPRTRERGPSGPPVRPDRAAVLRDLTDSLRGAARHTGGVDMLSRYLNTARRAESAGRLGEAADALRLAMAFAPDDPDVTYEHDRVQGELAASLADSFREQAIYEERNEKWAAAALSWARVFEGRPFDARPARKAAEALLKANGDLHKAKQLAQAAFELDRERVKNHVTLAKVFIAAKLPLNARRVLQEATTLDPGNEIVENLLRSLDGPKS